MSKVGMYLLIILGVYVLFCAFLFSVTFYDRKKSRSKAKKSRYDERQKTVQAKAYQYSFFTMLLYFLIWGIVADDVFLCETTFGVFFGVDLGVTVFAVICILGEAYVSLRTSRAATVVCMNAIFAGISLNVIKSFRKGAYIVDGVISNRACGLLFVAMIIVIDICFFIRWRMEKKAQRSADNDGAREDEK